MISIYVTITGVLNLVVAYVIPAVTHIKFLKKELNSTDSEHETQSQKGSHYLRSPNDSDNEKSDENAELLDRTYSKDKSIGRHIKLA